MRALGTSIVVALLTVPPLVACASHAIGLNNVTDDGGTPSSDDASVQTFGDDGPTGMFVNDAGPPGIGDSTNCKGGFYKGNFEGLYSSGIVGVFLHSPDAGAAINLPVLGDVQLTLDQTGDGSMTCTFEGESEKCSNFFSLQNGTISGTADGIFPYFCKMTGTLDCKNKRLVDGWIQCTYCVGFPIVDGGDCAINTPISEGKFAGPLVGDYFYQSPDGGPPSFGTAPLPGLLDGIVSTADAGRDPGTWNGAESLAGYPGTGPVPGGGTVASHLSDAGYGRIGVDNDYGGYGFWNAFYSPDGG
jgi:hypothetical protein